MEDAVMIRARLLDCGGRIAVLVRVFGWQRVATCRNPFRIYLSDADFRSGKPRWRWPVSHWARG